jgi:molybdopterin-containing oxidoreductase family iron-sulfur binding subunit
LRVNGRLEQVPWKTAVQAAAEKMKGAQSLNFLTGLESGTFESLVGEFTGAYPDGARAVLEPVSLSSMAAASQRLFGRREVPRIDLSQVTHMVSLGADFLDAWVSPVELTRAWAERHGMTADRALQLDYAGPRRNLTAVASDRWYRLRSSEVAQLALALLHGVYEAKHASMGADEPLVAGVIRELGPRPNTLSVGEEALKAMINRLVTARVGLVLFGGTEVIGRDATAVHTAALLTNYILGSVGPALRYGEDYALSKVDPEARVAALLQGTAQGSPEVLFVHGTNPVYSLPGPEGVRAKNRFVVCLATHVDETAQDADVVLPVHHPLETWGDFQVSNQVIGLMQPVREPLHHTEHPGDLLIEIAKLSQKSLSHRSYKEYLTKRWADRMARGGTEGPPPGSGQESDARTTMSESQWEQMLVNGGLFSHPEVETGMQVTLRQGDRLPQIGQPAEEKAVSAELVVPMSGLLYDGRGATLDWLREVPDSLTQTAWDIPLEVAPDVAHKHGIDDGSLVKVKSANGEVTARAVVESGLVSGTVSLRPGGGRAGARYSENTANPMDILGLETDPISGELLRAGTQVVLETVATGKLVSVMGSPHEEDRLLAISMDLGDVRAGRFPIMTKHGEVSFEERDGKGGKALQMPHEEAGGKRPRDNMYSLQEYSKHRWGMVVDLDRCTGCSACAVACYAENNIPVVGKLEVSRGRELSWIRIEKHLFGKGASEQLRFLPVMCQQCDNAPCESVCPVFASSHTEDGLNAQIYNRCIGTRYCSNNCPYKVRRFNYFDYEREKPGNQQLNPDVTVRSKGVMEKCTFCIQRIREVQNRLAVSGDSLQDGAIVPACVQTCPTGALRFGDFKQPDWTMSKLAKDPRGYRLLDYVVNTRPGVVYLRKVDTIRSGKRG